MRLDHSYFYAGQQTTPVAKFNDSVFNTYVQSVSLATLCH